MKKFLLSLVVLSLGWNMIYAQHNRVKGIPQNFEVISNTPVKAAPVSSFTDGFEDYADFSLNYSP